MPVLKKYFSTPAMREAIVLDLGDIGAQAARIRAVAETQAQKIIAGAQAKAESLAHQRGEQAQKIGYQEGLEKGLAEGRAAGRAEALANTAAQLQQITAAWSQVAQDWEQQRTEMEREARQAVLQFALAAAEKLVHRVIEVDEGVVVDQAAQALSLVLSAHDASVRIHPVDRPMLEDALPELLHELASLKHIDLVDDEAITPGGCIVTFGNGRIDATIEKQLQRMIDLILPEPLITEEDPEPDLDANASAPTIMPPNSSTAINPRDLIAPVYEITEQGLVESGAASYELDDDDQTTAFDEPEDEG